MTLVVPVPRVRMIDLECGVCGLSNKMMIWHGWVVCLCQVHPSRLRDLQADRFADQEQERDANGSGNNLQ